MRRLIRPLATSFGAIALVVAASTLPARADFHFQFPSSNFYLGLLPDTCIPIGTSEYCISFTNATWQTSMQSLAGQIQQAQMESQNLKDADPPPTDADGTQSADALCAAGDADPKTAAKLTAAFIKINAIADHVITNSVANQAFHSIGSLAASQMQAQAVSRARSAADAQLCMTAAQQTQDELQMQKSVDFANDMFDLNGSPSSGNLL